MEPSKVRVQELTLVYYAVRSLVHMEGIEEPEDDAWPNLGAIFAEHLTKLKMKPFQSTGRKRETVGSVLTPIFFHCGVLLDDADMDYRILYMDTTHLTSAQWLKDDREWSFKVGVGIRLVRLPLRSLTDFSHGLSRIQFRPDPRLIRAPVSQPRRYTVQRTIGP